MRTRLEEKPPHMTARDRLPSIVAAHRSGLAASRRLADLESQLEVARDPFVYVELLSEIEEVNLELKLSTAWLIHNRNRLKEDA